MDKISLERIDRLFPSLRNEAHKIYEEININLTSNTKCRITCTYRTDKEQDELYLIGRRGIIGEFKVTNAKAWESYHNYGLAIDFCLIIDKNGDGKYEEVSWNRNIDSDKDLTKDWDEVVRVFKKYGWEYGGDWKLFKDYPHFQKTFGKSIRELKKIKRKNGYPLL